MALPLQFTQLSVQDLLENEIYMKVFFQVFKLFPKDSLASKSIEWLTFRKKIFLPLLAPINFQRKEFCIWCIVYSIEITFLESF